MTTVVNGIVRDTKKRVIAIQVLIPTDDAAWIIQRGLNLYLQGRPLQVKHVDGTVFLTTDPNKTVDDNLESLKEIE